MGAVGVLFKIADGVEKLGNSIFQDRIRKRQVVGEFRHHPGDSVIGHARKKEDPGLVEIAAELILDKSQGPLERDVPQPAAQGDGGLDLMPMASAALSHFSSISAAFSMSPSVPRRVMRNSCPRNSVSNS